MAGFGIDFIRPGLDRDSTVAAGLISLGEEVEYFDAPIGYWGADDYRASWSAGLRRIADGARISCLVVSMIDPETANFVEVWPLYRDGDVVHVQNQLIFLDQVGHDFDPSEPWNSVSPRAIADDEGEAISEWTVSVADVEEFLDVSGG